VSAEGTTEHYHSHQQHAARFVGQISHALLSYWLSVLIFKVMMPLQPLSVG